MGRAIDSETAAAMDEGWNFPLDVFVAILLRLPTSARRRFRLVCRHWREVIGTRTAEMQSRPKTLAFVGDFGGTTVSAHVVDDLSAGLSRKLWTGDTTGRNHRCPDVAMVGTCNGLLCLCDKSKPGEITLVNPVTGETLLAPPLIAGRPAGAMNYEAYNFTYNPTTGQYKILHVPCFTPWAEKFEQVHVLTLGDASWRAVPTPGASCLLSHGLVGIDSTMFWVSGGDRRAIMSLDLEHERLTSTRPLPIRKGMLLHLAEVHGRLGVVTTVDKCSVRNFQIWVWEDERWSQRYSVYAHGPTILQSLAQPHFAQDKYILMREYTQERFMLYGHVVRDTMLPPSVMHINTKEQGTTLADISGCVRLTFSYVETTEPLSCYRQQSIDL